MNMTHNIQIRNRSVLRINFVQVFDDLHYIGLTIRCVNELLQIKLNNIQLVYFANNSMIATHVNILK